MNKTIWLASYPKSGNTWFRIFLANLLFPEQRPLDLNEMPLDTPIASNRILFDDCLGMPSSFLTPEEIAGLRPSADRKLRESWDTPLLVRKAHDAYTRLPDGRALMGQGPGFAAMYFLRDPWDVAVSTAHYFSMTLEEAVERMTDPHAVISNSRRALKKQLAQRLLTWDDHAVSWLTAPIPVHLMRYEDMKENPLPTFRLAVRFLGLDHDDGAIQDALAASSFDRLQKLEKEKRFKESPTDMGNRYFFRSGSVGEGLEKLSGRQYGRLLDRKRRVERLIHTHFEKRTQ